jgi:hypothetical protein
MVLTLAACGGSDGDGGDNGGTQPATTNGTSGADGDTDPTNAPDTTAPADGNGSGGGEVTEMGSFTVNGTVFAVTLLNRCEPFGDGPDDLSLQGLQEGAEGAKINLDKGANLNDVSVDGAGIEAFGSVAFASRFETPPESEISGDRWTGSATLFDILDVVDPVEVTWDLMIPSEINDCGL